MAALRIALLGGFHLERPGGGRIVLSTRKGALLLARLAVPPGTSHSREYLQSLLWQEADKLQGQGNLRYLLHRLRHGLACADAIVSEGSHVYLDSDRVAVDVDAFEQRVRQGTAEALAEACALYRGDLLAGVSVDEPGYEDWLLPERERLRGLARQAFWRHFELDIRRGDAAAAMDDARRYLDIEPYCERLHEALIRLHLARGERGLAARHYQRLKETLAQDLQVEPEPEITALVRSMIWAAEPARVPVDFDPAWVLGKDKGAAPGNKATLLDMDRQIIAVQPFTSLGRRLDQDGFADSITENLIADLSRFHSLVVLAHNSRIDPAGRSPVVKEIALELEPQFVLRGAVQASKRRVRILVRLIDGLTGSHVWAERYEHRLDDVVDLQDQISAQITATVASKISAAEAHWRIGSENPGPYDTARRAYALSVSALNNHSQQDCQRALGLAQQAIVMDRHCGLGYATIAECHLVEALFAWTSVQKTGLARAREAAERLQSQDPDDHAVYLLLGRAAFMSKQHDVARAYLQRAADLNPNDVRVLFHLAWLEGSCGLPEAARDDAELALRLNPKDAATRHSANWTLAQAAFVTGDYRAGVEYAQRSHLDMPHHTGGLGMLAACLAETGELAQAQAVIRQALRVGPAYMKDRLRGNSFFAHQADHDRFIRALRKAAGDLRL